MSTDRAWERWARIDPYYAVLTDERFRCGNDQTEFFRSGEQHIAQVIETASSFSPTFRPRIALDFGCGVGRLLVPLSRRVCRTIGVDVSKTMLEIAASNLRDRGILNCGLVTTADIPAGFDFLHSDLVFQHIPPNAGYSLFAELLSKLAPRGLGAVHFPYYRDAPMWKRLATATLNHVEPLVRLIHSHEPRMQNNHYSLTRLMTLLYQHDCRRVLIDHLPARSGSMSAMLYFLKSD